MMQLSDIEEQHAHPTSRALMERQRELLAPKFKRPKNRENDPITSTSDSEENQPPLRRRKPKKNPRKNETEVIETTTSNQIIQPPSIEYGQSSKFTLPGINTDVIKQNFDIEVIKKRHEELHAAAHNENVQESVIEFEKPINLNTSCGTSLSSIQTSSHSERSKSGEHSDETNASNQRESILSPPIGQIDHGNVVKQTNQPEMPIEVENPIYRVISVEDYLGEDVEELCKVKDQRKRTISVEDGEIEITECITNAQRQQEIEMVDLSLDDEEEEMDQNNVVQENVPTKTLQPAAAEEEPQRKINDNERSLVLMTEKPSNSFRRHRYKKSPRRIAVVEDIKRLQKSVGLLIAKLPFQRLVREIMKDQLSGDFHISGAAIAALHEATEMQIIELFEETVLLCTHRDRATIGLKDIHLACRLQEHFESKHRLG